MKKFLFSLLFIALGVALGAAIVFSGLSYLLVLLLIASTILLHTIAHELGHLVFALLTGFKFVSISLCSLAIYKYPDGLKIKTFSLAGAAGFCQMCPRNSVEKTSFFLYLFGGVLANIITSLAFVALLFFVTNIYAIIFCVSAIVIGIIFATLNGIPLNLNIANDGRLLATVYHSPENKLAYYQNLTSLTAHTHGALLSEFLAAHPVTILSPADYSNVTKLALKFTEIAAYYERLQFDAIRSEFNKMSKYEYTLPTVIHFEYLKELLFLDIVTGNRTLTTIADGTVSIATENEETDNLYAAVSSHLKQNHLSSKRILYAYYLLYKRDDLSAAKVKADFNALAKTYPILGAIKAEQILMNYIDTKPNLNVCHIPPYIPSATNAHI